MRRKKNIDLRIENCGKWYNSFNNEQKDARVIKKNLIDFKEFFGNENDVVLEIGCGKGKFATELAKKNPNINVLAVEKCDNVLVAAAEKARDENIENLRFICCGAEYLQRYIGDFSISALYLNFSCPYPKKRYSNNYLKK